MRKKDLPRVCFFATNYDHTRQNLIREYGSFLHKDADLYLFTAEEDVDKYETKHMIKAGYSGGKTKSGWELRKFCKDHKIDLVIGFSGTGEVGIMLSIATGFSWTDYIHHSHGNFFWKKSDIQDKEFAKIVAKFNLKNSLFLISQFFMKKFVICNREVAKRFKKIFIGSKICYLPSSVDTRLYTKNNKRKVTRKKYGIKDNDNVVIYTGRTSFLKGSDFLIEIIKKNPRVKFIVVGKVLDPEFINYKGNNLIIAGEIPNQNLIDLYSAADLGMFLSRTEGNPMAVREAMSAELPAIVLDIEALREIRPAIRAKHNIKDIQKKLDFVLRKSKKERAAMGREARKYIVENYSFDALKERYVKTFLH